MSPTQARLHELIIRRHGAACMDNEAERLALVDDLVCVIATELKALRTVPADEQHRAQVEARLAALERVSHPPVDMTAVITMNSDQIARMIEADPHTFSSRPCVTCNSISSILNRAFGCVARATKRG